MARLLTQKDVYAIINAMVEDLSGQTASMRAVDTSTFISCGELIMSYGKENVLNSLGLLIGRILIASRPYSGKFDLINAISTGLYSHRIEKISYYSSKALPSGAFNTDLYTNFADGFTAGENLDANGDPQSTKSQWEQNPIYPLTLFINGSSTWQTCLTLYKVQLQQAFRSPDEFNEFVSGMLTQKNNDIELEKQAFRQAIALNHIAGVYDLNADGDMPGSVVNLTEAFNLRYYGSDTTQYKTSEQLRSTYLKEFLGFMVATMKTYIKRMENASVNYHWTPEKVVGGNSLALIRHTPRSKQKLFLYEPLVRFEAESMVLPEIFNDRLLSIDNYEGIEYWQNENDPSAIEVYPAIPDTDSSSATFGTQIKGDKVELEYVVGMLFDEDACMVDFQLDDVDTTEIEKRKKFANQWYTFAKNGINDFTEKAVLFIMKDPTP